MDIPGYLTTEQAAERLGINPQSVYNLAHRAPDFPRPVKVGRTSLWPEEAVTAWRAAHPKRRATGAGNAASGSVVVDAVPPGGETATAAPPRGKPHSPPA